MSQSNRAVVDLAEWTRIFHEQTESLNVGSSKSQSVRTDEVQVQIEDLNDKISALEKSSSQHRSDGRITLKEYRTIESLTAEYSIKLDNIKCAGRVKDSKTKSDLLERLGKIDACLGALKSCIEN